MELALERDMEKLFGDTEKVQQGLEVLEKDHTAWNRVGEREDLAEILEGVKGLEFDVSNLMGDCVSLQYTDQGNGEFNQAFSGLNTLFEDLKTARRELDQSYVTKDELAQLEIDWARFRKAVDQIQENLLEH